MIRTFPLLLVASTALATPALAGSKPLMRDPIALLTTGGIAKLGLNGAGASTGSLQEQQGAAPYQPMPPRLASSDPATPAASANPVNPALSASSALLAAPTTPPLPVTPKAVPEIVARPAAPAEVAQPVAASRTAPAVVEPAPVAAAAAAVNDKPAQPAAGPQPDAVDVAALYYYARENQRDRIDAEIARLRVKFPGFQPPADLFVPVAERIDEEPLWALYKIDDFAGIDEKIAAMKVDHPNWTPSDDFTTKLARRKLRLAIEAASEAKNWAGVLEASRQLDPMTEQDFDLLWRYAEAAKAQGASDTMTAIYRGILFRKDRPADDILVTTLQKATADFPPQEIRNAIGTLWPVPGSIPALQSINDDMVRREVADFNGDDTRHEPLPEVDIARLRQLAASPKAKSENSLLGWYFLKVKQPAEAEKAFSAGMAIESNPDFAKGLYLALAAQAKDDQAYQIAASHLGELKDDPEFLMNALSLRFSHPQLARPDAKAVEAYSRTIMQVKSAAHAEILGWYAYNSGQFQASAAWFSTAFDWEPSPDRIKGFALSLMHQNQKKAFAALMADYQGQYPDVFAEILTPRPRPLAMLDMSGQAVIQPASWRAMPVGGQPGPMASYLQVEQMRPQAVLPAAPVVANVAPAPKAEVPVTTRSIKPATAGSCSGAIPAAPEAALARGWCSLDYGRTADARQAFAYALQGRGKVGEEAAYGAALTALRVGLTDEASATVSAYQLSPAHLKEVNAAIYMQRAQGAFTHKQWDLVIRSLDQRLAYQAETADVSEMRAWAHYHMGNTEAAKAIFERLHQRFDDISIQRGLTVASGG